MFDFLKRKKQVFFCLLALSAFSFVAGCSKAKEPPRAPVVEVVPVIIQDVPETAEWVGSIDGSVNAQIRAQVSGYLIKQNYQEGRLVQEGDVLFEIDPRPFEASLAKAQATLAESQARWETAKSTYARVKPLADQNALSKKDLDDAFGDQETSGAQVQEAKAMVDKAQLDLEFTKIKSPITGIAGLAKVQIGNLVGPSTAEELTTVSTLDPVKVYIEISEQQYLKTSTMYPEAKNTHALELYLTDGSLFSKEGYFVFADRQVNPTTGTMKVAAFFSNPKNLLRPGQYARLRATLAVHKDAKLVPQKSVIQMQGVNQVAVVGKDNTVEIRSVQLGGENGEYFVVQDGLNGDENVVVEGLEKVRSGLKVDPKPSAENFGDGKP
ncbi:MAG TPA: efflux RND transporter periplasmic adaptor subunit [Candidatus Omnitrophota bacterium]|nr:efflux RND transporter periplasmic adaptor subunit [Candidatus Omnitrophota bacterium]HPD84254.1 efflux RND transporter periplasmic adaptor subunit [Candidatus Omnitrophota bacterium]HRZ03110.1 efflux RND transporter periplasmic adaptor subunit [Candidatus Omnitrophota bacterium]